MFSLHTYRARLTIYTLTLLAFLVGTLAYSYRATRDALLQAAEENMDRTVQLLDSQIAAERNEMLRYAVIVRDDLPLQEYMFIVVRIGSDLQPLRELYDTHFGWLPVTRRAIIAADGRVLLGEREVDLADKLSTKLTDPVEQTFLFQGARGLELVAMAPVHYRGDRLGIVAISHVFSMRQLRHLKKQSRGELFIVQDGIVLNGTVDSSIGRPFRPQGRHILLGSDRYHVRTLDLPNSEPGTPRLWFAVSERQLTENLDGYRKLTLLLVTFGGAVILIMGLVILRNFNRPLNTLVSITGEIADGKLPKLAKRLAYNEIDHLTNHFADMLQSLRDKQAEIERVHAQLEELAITDTLTGLYNRRHLQELYPKLRAQAQRDRKCLTLILADLDYFKRINDCYGHMCGDTCLIHFAGLLDKCSRANDFLFRMGGEEFLILGINDDATGGASLAEKVRVATVNAPVECDGSFIHMTVSCGISSTGPHGAEDVHLSLLLSQADKALYRAKQAGRNQVKAYAPEQDTGPACEVRGGAVGLLTRL